MNYSDYEIQLGDAVRGLPTNALSLFVGDDVATVVQMIGAEHELLNRDIGEMCELVRQIITKEKPPEGFEERLKEKLDEDNQPKAGDIVQALVEKVFAKLLPTLGIKVPLEMAIKPATARGVPLNKVTVPIPVAPVASAAARPAQPPASPVPPPRPISVSTPPSVRPVQGQVTFKGFAGQPHRTYQEPRPKPPLMETDSERLSDNQLESLMKMLGGKISERELSHQLEKLPDSLKSVLGSVDAAKKVLDIGRSHGLHVDVLGELGAETGMVILGFTRPSQFSSRLTHRLGLSAEQVEPIVEEINTEIFLKIRDALKNIHGESEMPISVAIPAMPIPVPPSPAEASSSGGRSPQAARREGEPRPLPTRSDKELSNLPAGDLQTSEPPAEETLDRDAILRDIENPSNITFKTSTTPAQPIARKNEAVPEKPTEKPPEPTAQTVRPASPSVPPRPTLTPAPAQNPPAPYAPKINTPENQPLPPKPPAPPIPAPKMPPPAPPQPSKLANIIDQKLSGATASTVSEKNYSAVDPYREQI